MILKNFKILLTIILLSTTAFARQNWNEPEPVTFGIRAGFDFQNITGTNAAGGNYEGDLAPAYHLGVVADVPIATDFYIQPGLFYKVKGSNNEIEAINTDYKTRIRYLELPVSLLYKPILGDGNLVVAFGPYLAIGVGGKVEVDNGSSETIDVEFTSSVDANSDPDMAYFRRWDAGANFTVGYQFLNNISAQLNAQFGLTDINPEMEMAGDETSIRNVGFGISIGYHF